MSKPEPLNEEEGTIIDIKRYGSWLIISYKGKFGISFHKVRIDDGKLRESSRGD